MEQLISQLTQRLQLAGKIVMSRNCSANGISLYYPREPWYVETAPEMLRLIGQSRHLLEEGLGMRRSEELICLVTDPDWALAKLGVAGLAMERVMLVACRRRCLSEFAGTAAHELAHLLSRSIGACENPFKCEGFACYAAEVTDADTRPFGLPLHYHLRWMLSVGLRPSIPELWHRRDYTSELYDLAWSFTTYAVETFGLERYYRFYRTVDLPLDVRIRDSLGTPLARLERDWHAFVGDSVDADAASISRMRRYTGAVCSRAAWLGSR